MRIALKEAAKGCGLTSPNPRVGAVLVKDGRELARGFHRAYGEPHAEVDCLAKLKEGEAEGSTMYVNLEPCCHHGKTPPCTAAIEKAGVRRVVYGMSDPNQKVAGGGLKQLRAAGIAVSGPILESEARDLNRGYIKYLETGRPWVTLKFAQSLDGRIATRTGDSRWISSPHSLKLAHQLRAEHDADMVGINTALADDPQLTVRRVKGTNPYRIVLDPELRLNPNAKVFDAEPLPVLIATKENPPPEKALILIDKGAELIELPDTEDGSLDTGVLLNELGGRGIHYLLVEGGAGIFKRIIKAGLFDEIIVITAPVLIGGDGIASVPSLGIQKVADAVKLKVYKRKSYGSDLVVWHRPLL